MSDRDDFGSFLAGFIVGGLAGAVVALLFAPQSGEETRAMIKDKAIELSEKASDTFEEVSTKAEDFAKDTYKKAEDLYDQAKAKVSTLKPPAKIALSSGTAPKTKKPVKAG
jgi:gas vesicle protein